MPDKISICEDCGMVLPADLDVIQEHMNKHAGVGEVQVSVWNCRAEPVYIRAVNDRVYLSDIDADEETRTRLIALAEQSVDEAGGALNMSGWCPANADLDTAMRELLTADQTIDELLAVMTVEEVAERYSLDAGGVRATILRGSIPARKSGRTWLIRRRDAEKKWKDTDRKRPGRKSES